jgi:hypothetical protein
MRKFLKENGSAVLLGLIGTLNLVFAVTDGWWINWLVAGACLGGATYEWFLRKQREAFEARLATAKLSAQLEAFDLADQQWKEAIADAIANLKMENNQEEGKLKMSNVTDTFRYGFTSKTGEPVYGTWEETFPLHVITDADAVLGDMIRGWGDNERELLLTATGPMMLMALPCTEGYTEHVAEYERQEDIEAFDAWIERDGIKIFSTKIRVGVPADIRVEGKKPVWVKRTVPEGAVEIRDLVEDFSRKVVAGEMTIEEAMAEVQGPVLEMAQEFTKTDEFNVVTAEQQAVTYENLSERDREILAAVTDAVIATVTEAVEGHKM